jgi:exopolysaccharide biosynthesis predicted pyruvyltransferase EpsI
MKKVIEKKLTNLHEFFANLEYKNFYYHRYSGNNGDTLIDVGTQIFFRKHKININNNIKECECIILCGGGGIVKEWMVGIEFLSFANINYPNIPIIVLPSTLGKRDLELVSNFDKREANFYIWAREEYTFDILKSYSKKNFYIGIDHDMAFHAKDSDDLIVENKRAGYILLVERFDAEFNISEAHAIKQKQKFILSKILKKTKQLLPRKLRRKIIRNLKPSKWQNRPFVKASLQEIYNDYPEAQKSNIMYCDISLRKNATYSEFLNIVKKAEFISTTRLHVAILGYLMNKPVYIKYGENLEHKIKGVYEFSLKNNPLIKTLNIT